MPAAPSQPPEVVAFLQTPAAAAALAELAARDLGPAFTLALLEDLRRRFAPDQSAALLTQAHLRQRARAKFPYADRMFFVEEALEQATAWPIAAYRARRIHDLAPPGSLLDLGCGIGGDLLALAHFRPVAGYELDPLRAAFARFNAAAVPGEPGPSHSVTVYTGDWVAALDAGALPAAAAAFADPARRDKTRRLFGLEAMQPPLSALLRLQARVPALAVKIAPGVRDEELPAGAAVEFVSHEGICKEAVLWFGPLAGGARRRAAVYDGREWHTIPSAGAPPPAGPLAPGQVLYEPDPAVVRAGALAELCAQLDAHLIEPSIAYLAAAHLRPTPFARAFAVREFFPFSLKRLNARLQDLGVGSVELKKRGFPLEPEALRPRLRLVPHGAPLVVILTRRGDDHWAILCDRVPA